MSDYLQPWDQDAWIDEVDLENFDWASFDDPGLHCSQFPTIPLAAADPASPHISRHPLPQIAQPHVAPFVLEGPDSHELVEDDGPTNRVTYLTPGQTMQIPGAHQSIATAFVAPGSLVSTSRSKSDASAGSKAVLVTSTRGSTTASQAQQSSRRKFSQALTCTFVDCSYEGTFPRQYELKRHIAVKHQGSKPFRCPVVGCFKGTAPSAFARSDKLADHIRSVHSLDTTIFCPDPQCLWHLLSHDLLAVHIRKVHLKSYNYNRLSRLRDYDRNIETLRAIVNAASLSQQKCPIRFCKKHVPLESLVEHVMLHPPAEVESVVEDLAGEGYLAKRGHLPDTGHSAVATDPHGVQLPIKRLLVVCPICSSGHRDHKDFAGHMLDDHLVSQEHKALLDQKRKRDQRSCDEAPEWRKQRLSWETAEGMRSLVAWCHGENECGTTDGSGRHLVMPQDTAKLKSHRRRILKLYPNFISWTHIWDDLAHPVRCAPWQKTVVENETID